MSRNVLVLGASGRTGRHLLAQGLELGHDMVALARNPDTLEVEHERLRVVAGGATDPTAVDEALDRRDAVICALGPRSPAALVRCDLMRATMGVLLPAMEERRVKRLVLLSALGVGGSARHAPRPLRLTFKTLFRQVGKDKAAAEESVRASDLDWTIVYPPSLTNGTRTSAYRSGEALEVKGLPKLSRADLAEFMLAAVEQTRFSRKIAILTP